MYLILLIWLKYLKYRTGLHKPQLNLSVNYTLSVNTFNNSSVISRWLVLLTEETGAPGENHRRVASHWQTLSHNVVSSTPRHELKNLLSMSSVLIPQDMVDSSLIGRLKIWTLWSYTGCRSLLVYGQNNINKKLRKTSSFNLMTYDINNLWSVQ
jgi:hypothetical protein